jgi:hypothetical protein
VDVSGQFDVRRITTITASRKALRESLFTAGELIRVDQLEPEPNSAQQLELFR